MVLSDIKHYLQDRRQASLRDLTLHFDTDRQAMQGMLEHWIQKGRVARCDLRGACGRGCSDCACDDATLQLYEWRS